MSGKASWHVPWTVEPNAHAKCSPIESNRYWGKLLGEDSMGSAPHTFQVGSLISVISSRSRAKMVQMSSPGRFIITFCFVLSYLLPRCWMTTRSRCFKRCQTPSWQRQHMAGRLHSCGGVALHPDEGGCDISAVTPGPHPAIPICPGIGASQWAGGGWATSFCWPWCLVTPRFFFFLFFGWGFVVGFGVRDGPVEAVRGLGPAHWGSGWPCELQRVPEASWRCPTLGHSQPTLAALTPSWSHGWTNL